MQPSCTVMSCLPTRHLQPSLYGGLFAGLSSSVLLHFVQLVWSLQHPCHTLHCRGNRLPTRLLHSVALLYKHQVYPKALSKHSWAERKKKRSSKVCLWAEWFNPRKPPAHPTHTEIFWWMLRHNFLFKCYTFTGWHTDNFCCIDNCKGQRFKKCLSLSSIGTVRPIKTNK